MRHTGISGKDGFTLIELMVALLVSSIFALLVFSYFLYNSTLYAQAKNEADAQKDCSDILEILTVAAKECSNIEERDITGSYYEFINESGGNKGTVTFDGKTLKIEMDGVLYPDGNGYKNIEFFDIDKINGLSDVMREIKVTAVRGEQRVSLSATISMRNR